MRYDVKKFLFLGFEKERNAFFKRAQDAGIINFVNSNPLQIKQGSEEAKTIRNAISILRGLQVVDQEEATENEVGLGMAQKIISIKNSLDKLLEEERTIQLEMSRVEIFGDFSLEDIALIENQGDRKVQFYCAKRGTAEKEEVSDELIYVDSDHGLDYFIGLSKQSTQYPKMIEIEIKHPWGELKRKDQEVKTEIAVLENRLKEYSKYNRFLHHVFVHELNEFHLNEAKNFVEFPIDQEQLFVVQGWVPAHKIDQMKQLVDDMQIYVEEVEPDLNDIMPTYLENEGVAKIGEDLVNIYDTPSKTDKDPSIWVLVFFALFFSMIIGDGGYGLVLLLIALYIRCKHSNLRSYKKRALDLFTILGFSCLVWGVLTTSFFGISISPDNSIRKVSLMTWLVEKKADYHIQNKDEVFSDWLKKYPALGSVKDPKEFLLKASSLDSKGNNSYEAFSKFSDNIMMELALLVGVIHIILSMCRYVSRTWSLLGWMIVIIGAYLYAPVFLNASSIPNFVLGLDREIAAKNGLYMIYGGFLIAVLIALFHQKLFGLLEATLAIQIFGDVLSYMRLYALGLSGSLLTATMMDLAASVPLIFGIFILAFGHLINIVLGVMGGVIHGLRLNFLEWYHYSFEGGGRMFNPLKKQEID